MPVVHSGDSSSMDVCFYQEMKVMQYCTKKGYCGQRSVNKDADSIEAVWICEASLRYRCPFMSFTKVYVELKFDKVC